MSAYEKLMMTLTLLSNAIDDEISVEVSIKENYFWIDLKSSNGKSIEKIYGDSLLCVGVMHNGEINKVASLIQSTIVGDLCGNEYRYDANGDKRHTFRL